jgi:hypothetical protein
VADKNFLRQAQVAADMAQSMHLKPGQYVMTVMQDSVVLEPVNLSSSPRPIPYLVEDRDFIARVVESLNQDFHHHIVDIMGLVTIVHRYPDDGLLWTLPVGVGVMYAASDPQGRVFTGQRIDGMIVARQDVDGLELQCTFIDREGKVVCTFQAHGD